MKKAILLGALVVVAAASCSKSQYLGQKPQKVEKQSPIEIGSSIGTPTKANSTGADAAALLSNKFYVWGQKTVGGTTSSVFNQVPVEYNQEDGWSYVSATEALRYWDSNASGYDFIAISDANTLTDISKVMEKVSPKANVYADGFTIAESSAEQLAKIHVTTVSHAYNTQFTSPVTFTFSNAAAKVRVGFYNAIPGYHVEVDSFALTDGTDGEKTVLKGSFYSKAAFNVDKEGAITISGTPTAATDIVLGSKIVNCPNPNQYIGNSITTASYDTLDEDHKGLYTSVIPVMGNGQDIKMTVKYHMVSGHEEIARTANVTIPANYTKWQPNYAYTYLFKITDNDLHPITFSAIVKDADRQESVTTIDGENPVNITISSAGSDVTVNGGVKVGNDVFVSVANVPVADYYVHSAFTTNDEINGSNADSIIPADGWTLRSHTTGGRYQIETQAAGNYVVRVSWTTEDSKTHYAYMVFRAVA